MASEKVPEHRVLDEHIYDGMVMCGGFPAKVLDAVKEFDFHDVDIIIATYPKSGTTWMQAILYLVMEGADLEKAKERPLAERVPFIELYVPGLYENIDVLRGRPSPRLIKTHLARSFYDRMLRTKKTKVIVVMRNAKDTMVSYYHFYRADRALGSFQGSFEQFLEMADDKRLVHGDCYDFSLSWWAEKDNPNVMFTTYEAMSDNIEAVIRQVAAFVGKTLSDQQVATIRAEVGFDKMSSNDSVLKRTNVNLDPKVSTFMRKGKVGDWRNHFSQDHRDKYDQVYRDRIVGTGLEHLLSDGN